MRVAIVVILLLAACSGPVTGAADAGTDAAAVDPCAELDLAACRADSSCVVDTCLTCSCTPSFAGCRSAAAAPHPCPEVACAQPACCRAQGDCTSGACAIDPSPGCGACLPGAGDCTSDAHCSGGDICEPVACSCEGARGCVAGCETTGCDLGQTCDAASHRCVDRPCGPDGGACPANFVCTWPEGGCMRQSCSSDDNCPSGYCALGLCQESLGTCVLPAP